ncbi:MAG: DNA polymerase III subunit delta [bacterium]
MKELDYLEAIKLAEEGKWFPVYILLGNSLYLKDRFLKALSDNFLASEGDLEIREAGENDLETLLENQENACLFSLRRVLYLKNVHELKPGSRKELYKRIRSLKDQILILEQEGSPEELSDVDFPEGVLVKDPILGEKQLRNWIIGSLGRKGKRIPPEAVEFLLTHTDGTLDTLVSEIEKISLYEEGEVISKETVEKIITPSIEGTAFELVEAVLTGKKGKAISLLNQILYLGKEAPGRLIFLLFRQFRLLWQLANLGEIKRPDYFKLAQKLGDHPLAVKKALECLNRYTRERAQEALEALVGIDKKIKQGGEDPHLLLEKFIVEFSS